ncbi:MAG TPA: cytochrome c biogenesis protein CcsA [Longimicrobiales bacterium]|jgi:heme exporter protein C|nr:cytochrome c biogenesis protein CcsA [Longimicrobiales bacterium]
MRTSLPTRLLGFAAVALTVVALWTGYRIAPPDRLMGDAQRIMYVHVPAAWSGFLAFFIVFLASIGYLVRKDRRLDHLAHAAAEVGVLFMALGILLGSIWGKPTWGVWWTWDPRLTSSAVLLAIYLGYLALRAFTDDADRRARWSAAVGIIGFLDVPIVYLSVLWWRTLHQPPSSPETIARPMLTTLWLGVGAFTLLLAWFVLVRYRLSRAEGELEMLEVSHA